MPISKSIKVKTDYSKSSNSDFSLICDVVCKNTYGNIFFPKPPISFEDFRGKLGEYKGLIVLAGDSKKALSKRDSVRREMAKMFALLGHYVEAVCDDDDAIFSTSGFERIPNKRQPAQHLKTPAFVKITHGPNSGTVVLTLPPRPA